VETDRDVEDFLENHLEGVCFADSELAQIVSKLVQAHPHVKIWAVRP
jgi:hypothetical protein